ncbi:Hexosaminidase D [Frankliniella fusca]|uniref:Hexosaminidase D n=1 Tax=Frankliniella fusca TaxID=407009 RepID=A0AAE1LWP7_9NEOP|nr:Hexosaminidase D [Frankliniella fusca]
MALLRRVMCSSISLERSLALASSRGISNLPCNFKSSANEVNNVQDVIKSFPKSPRNSPATSLSVERSFCDSLLNRIDSVILPMSPAEQLIKLRLPTIIKHVSLEMPTTKASLDNAHINQVVVEIKAPQRGKVLKQLAIRMLVIRRRKMKKHQRKKWLKKFRVHNMTQFQKKKIKKETIFLSALEEQMKTAESFDPKKYAIEKIRKAYTPLPVRERPAKKLPWEFQPLFAMSQKKNGK